MMGRIAASNSWRPPAVRDERPAQPKADADLNESRQGRSCLRKCFERCVYGNDGRHAMNTAIGTQSNRLALAASASVAIASSLLGAAQGPAAADEFVSAVGRMRRSVAPIVCRTGVAEKPISGILGSAFFVSAAGEFVTAAHVLPTSPCALAVYLPDGGWTAETGVVRFFNFDNSCQIDETADIAACKTNADLTTVASGIDMLPVVLDASTYPVDGTAIAFTGFPIQNVQPLTARGHIAAFRPALLSGGPRWILDRAAWPGSSGGPVFLSDGRVIGIIIQFGINDGTGLAYARPAASIMAVINAFRQAAVKK
jgi:S1-C subfamily serine protease